MRDYWPQKTQKGAKIVIGRGAIDGRAVPPDPPSRPGCESDATIKVVKIGQKQSKLVKKPGQGRASEWHGQDAHATRFATVRTWAEPGVGGMKNCDVKERNEKCLSALFFSS